MKTKHTFAVSALIRRAKMNKHGEVPVYLRITLNGKLIEISTKHFIAPSLWDSKLNKVKGKSPVAKVVNDTIDILKLKAKQEYNTLAESYKEICLRTIKNRIFGVKAKQPTLLEVFAKMVNKVQALIGNEYTESTYKNYLASQRQLSKYIQHQFKAEDRRLIELDYRFIADYELYLKTKGGCTQNGCIKHMQKLRKAITIALKHDMLDKDPFLRYSIKKKKVIVQPLTKHELIALENKFFSTERLCIIRDLFVFSCYTGLAFSDASALQKNNIRLGIDGEEWIFIDRRKTGSICKVPLLPPAKNIINRYMNHPKVVSSGCLLPLPSNQKYNAYLKEVGEIVGITKPLKTHLARHTYATTITLQNGVSIEAVKELLGHADIQTTQIYAKVKDELIAKAIKPLREKYRHN